MDKIKVMEMVFTN